MKISNTIRAKKVCSHAEVIPAAWFPYLLFVLQLFAFLFLANTGQAQSCEKSSSCFTFRFNGTTDLPGNNVLLSFSVQTNCNKSLSNVAFSLPNGIYPLQPTSSYSALYSYNVENTTNNPFYSIKFEATNAESFKNGQEDVFEYVLSAYDFANLTSVKIKAKAANLTGEVEIELVECLIATPLPVELARFSATALPQHVALSWATASETDNAGFAIERSTNGNDFAELGFLPGNGTTNKACSYTFTDYSPAPGTAYYRLKQTDFNGTHEYSPTRAVTFAAGNDAQPQLIAHPNPAGNTTSLQLPENLPPHAIITITAATGHVVYREPAQSMAIAGYQVNTSQLQPGIYFITLSGAQNTSPFRLVKL